MKIRSATFIKSGTRPEHYPDLELPEVAFAGRSNVGKSSLMNVMMARKRLVKVSGTPGRTQLLSWFKVNDEIVFCDLPGYGFAKVPNHVRSAWGTMVNTYFASRDALLVLVLLTDVRRGFEEDDLQLFAAAAKLGMHAILVVTKCDKLKPNALYSRQRAIARDLGVDPDADIVWFSALDGRGRDVLWRRIRSLTPTG